MIFQKLHLRQRFVLRRSNMLAFATVFCVLANCFAANEGEQQEKNKNRVPFVMKELKSNHLPAVLGGLALASADFDEDGVPDLIAGYAAPRGGILALHRAV